MKNLELKARLVDRGRARAAALELGARAAGVEEQRDTFFHAPRGRLKLRETAGQGAWLIGYQRGDRSEARISEYTLVAIGDPAGLREALAATLGIRGEVRKRREILLWENVRIHLDAVAGLGAYLEFEAVLGAGAGEDEATAATRLAMLAARLGIEDADRVSVAYADLLGLGE